MAQFVADFEVFTVGVLDPATDLPAGWTARQAVDDLSALNIEVLPASQFSFGKEVRITGQTGTTYPYPVLQWDDAFDDGMATNYDILARMKLTPENSEQLVLMWGDPPFDGQGYDDNRGRLQLTGTGYVGLDYGGFPVSTPFGVLPQEATGHVWLQYRRTPTQHLVRAWRHGETPPSFVALSPNGSPPTEGFPGFTGPGNNTRMDYVSVGTDGDEAVFPASEEMPPVEPGLTNLTVMPRNETGARITSFNGGQVVLYEPGGDEVRRMALVQESAMPSAPISAVLQGVLRQEYELGYDPPPSGYQAMPRVALDLTSAGSEYTFEPVIYSSGYIPPGEVATVQGTVYDHFTNEPITNGGEVSAFQGPDEVKYVSIGQDGTYTLANLEPGEYDIRVAYPPEGYNAQQPGANVVTLEAGETRNIDLFLIDPEKLPKLAGKYRALRSFDLNANSFAPGDTVTLDLTPDGIIANLLRAGYVGELPSAGGGGGGPAVVPLGFSAETTPQASDPPSALFVQMGVEPGDAPGSIYFMQSDWTYPVYGEILTYVTLLPEEVMGTAYFFYQQVIGDGEMHTRVGVMVVDGAPLDFWFGDGGAPAEADPWGFMPVVGGGGGDGGGGDGGSTYPEAVNDGGYGNNTVEWFVEEGYTPKMLILFNGGSGQGYPGSGGRVVTEIFYDGWNYHGLQTFYPFTANEPVYYRWGQGSSAWGPWRDSAGAEFT